MLRRIRETLNVNNNKTNGDSNESHLENKNLIK